MTLDLFLSTLEQELQVRAYFLLLYLIEDFLCIVIVVDAQQMSE